MARPVATKSGVASFDPYSAASQNASSPVHPILGLLAEGERRWSELVEKQSRTLEEAVVEYRKRYKRAPPKGFDHWWNFAQAAQVLLPDEVSLAHQGVVDQCRSDVLCTFCRLSTTPSWRA